MWNKPSSDVAANKAQDSWAAHGPVIWEQALEALVQPKAAFPLDRAQAKVVLSYMHPFPIAQGVEFIQEGDAAKSHYLVLVVDGEVTVETITVSRTDPMTVTVVGHGSIHGELGMLDGSPRSASCTASTPVLCGMLTRNGYARLLKEHPEICARFTIMLAMRIGDRLRDNTLKLKRFAMLTTAMYNELQRVMPDE
jgi:CRP/FNR family transcriptional regulator, cyclic AMP receptor protein